MFTWRSHYLFVSVSSYVHCTAFSLSRYQNKTATTKIINYQTDIVVEINMLIRM